MTWGDNRTVTAAGSGTGNRTVTVTDTGHYLKAGDKVSITGALSALVNGVHVIEVIDDDSYRFTLPHDGVASVTGNIRSRGVASAWLSSANAYILDSSPKGNNATLAVSAIAIGAIKTVDVYNFGAGYETAPTITTTTGNRNAELSATLGAFAEYAGYYVGSTGLISGTPKIQDNFYYQDFSYVLKTDLDITDYRDSVKRLTHPSGMLLFGEVAFRNKVSVEMFDAGARNINSTEPDTGKTVATPDVPKYRLTVPTINSYANVQYQTITSNNELEIYTAKHAWQAMDGKIDVRGDESLLYEDFRDVTMQRTSISGTNAYATITETLHNLEVGDTIIISGDRGQWGSEGDYFNGQYTVYSVPTTNTYTVYMYKGDPGASVSASVYLYVYLEDDTTGAPGQMILETGDQVLDEHSDDDVPDYVKVETIAFANNFRADPSNWEAPFNTAPIDELDSGRWMLEHGGSYLYPPIEFPMAESGTVSIDMSFNSDVLLEDRTAGDLGMSDYSGYVLTEESGTVGNGPARYISLEEDTEGIEEGHIIQSIPYMETEVITTLLDSMRQGMLTEDGMDDFVLESLTIDTHDLAMEDLLLILEDGNAVLNETGGTIPLEENEFKLLQDDGRTGYPSASELGYIVVEFEEASWSQRPDERRRFITEDRPFITDTVLKEYKLDLIESTGWHLLMEDYSHHIYEDGTRALTEESHVKDGIGEIEFNFFESFGYHLMMEDGVHVGYEDGTRPLIDVGKLAFEQSTHIPFVSEYNGNDLIKWNIDKVANNTIVNTFDTSEIVSSTFGVQAFRPHYTSQWPSFTTGTFADDKFTMEDDAGVIILEHPIHNRNYLISEDYPAAYEDLLNPNKVVLDFILLEEQTGGHPDRSFIGYEEATTAGLWFLMEDGTGQILTETGDQLLNEEPVNTGQSMQRTLLETSQPPENYGTEYTPDQYWSVLPAYQYTKVLERFTGKITFADGGTTGSGAETLFTTELKVGDEFQTADENIIDEDSGGAIVFETDERIEHETITISDVQNVALNTELLEMIPAEFRWLISNEDSPLNAHATHPGVIGTYELWDTGYHFVTHESLLDVKIAQEDDGGIIERQVPEWENNNMLWEDLSKQLITEPQAFIVGAITNDTTLTVTRKHLGGVSDSVYQM